jgi:FkbM family methyltransferase
MLHLIKPLFYRKFKTSFSKSGEDIQLWQLLKKNKGTFIDIGGHHPIYGSNSYFFYVRGWRGIVVEPNPIFKSLYNKYRKGDKLVSKGVADLDGELDYYELIGTERNTFSSDYIKEFSLENTITSTKKFPVNKLSTLLSTYLIDKNEIDFLCIDVEGMQFSVIKSNDWKKYRPSYILLESHNPLQVEIDSDLVIFLSKNDYTLIGKSVQGVHLGTLWFRANETIFPSI